MKRCFSKLKCTFFQAKLTAEVDALGKDWTATFSDVHEKLPYMDAVLKESLRLYPPGHLLFREAEADTLVEGPSPFPLHLTCCLAR
jgi:cytochrome P450